MEKWRQFSISANQMLEISDWSPISVLLSWALFLDNCSTFNVTEMTVCDNSELYCFAMTEMKTTIFCKIYVPIKCVSSATMGSALCTQ
jgi:hypothetical protein